MFIVFNRIRLINAIFVGNKRRGVCIMPYSEKAQYKHNRQLPPNKFVKKTLRTVSLSHTDYSGEKFNVPGAKAIVGKLKLQFRKKGKSGKPVAWKIQSILIPKR